MTRTVHDLTQGSAEWLALRARHYCASEAAAMLGLSSHRSRAALLREKASGFSPDAHPARERAFRRGHETEAAARARAEAELGEELYPATVTCEVDGLPLLASLDGWTMDGSTVWEHKLWRADLATHLELTDEPVEEHVWQLEQQLLVTGAERALYTISDETHWVTVEYRSRPERRARLIEGWRRFSADLEAERARLVDDPRPEGVIKPPLANGRDPGQLPALAIQIEGRIVVSNFGQWCDVVLPILRAAPRELTTDDDFATAELFAKRAREAEKQLEAAKKAALAQTKELERLFRAISEVGEELRALRLDLERRVKARKEQIRLEIQREALDTVRAWWATASAELGSYAPQMPSDAALRIAEAMKSRKTVTTLREAALEAAGQLRHELADRLTRARACLEVARRLEAEAGGSHLWPDLAAQIQSGVAPEHLEAVLWQRVWNARAVEQAAQIQRGLGLEPPMIDARPPSAPTAGALDLGEINRRIAPLQITAAGLAQLGVTVPCSADAWPAAVDAMIAVLQRAK